MDIVELKERFRQVFPDSPEPAACRAPGRVNLIGEHTDYNGLPVLPMAIAQELQVAFAARGDGQVNLHNVDPAFGAAQFQNGPALPKAAGGSWENYVKAAIQGLNRHLGVTKYPGMDLLVSSSLPMAAGLSSSSALVVASALCYLAALGRTLGEDISRLELAEVLAESEHFVGTRGGGMDQTVILNGVRDTACKIDFFPLRVELAPLPGNCRIVVCDSMVKADKSGSALTRYNAGPRLCALACALVERQLQEEFDEEIELERLGDLWYGPLCLTHREAQDICLRAVPEERMGLSQAAARLGCSAQEVRERCVGDLPEPEEGFDLQARLRHQFTEYRRVELARDALLAGDSAEFGRLMNASHESCAKDFKISSPELDALVAAAREAGALGARLTGAGFGGATVNLVPAAHCADFMARVRDAYYRKCRGYEGAPPMFVASASAGASYLT